MDQSVKLERAQQYEPSEVLALLPSLTLFRTVLNVFPVACPLLAPFKWSLTALTYFGREPILDLGLHGMSLTRSLQSAPWLMGG